MPYLPLRNLVEKDKTMKISGSSYQPTCVPYRSNPSADLKELGRILIGVKKPDDTEALIEYDSGRTEFDSGIRVLRMKKELALQNTGVISLDTGKRMLYSKTGTESPLKHSTALQRISDSYADRMKQFRSLAARKTQTPNTAINMQSLCVSLAEDVLKEKTRLLECVSKGVANDPDVKINLQDTGKVKVKVKIGTGLTFTAKIRKKN